jgi:sugar (pentulose or hexulose) kinase
MRSHNVAIIDIGKTNVKLVVVCLSDLSELAVITRPNTVLQGPPYPHFDVEGHWEFILKGLSHLYKEHGFEAITVTSHGASGALLAKDGSLAAPILDYEFTGLDETASAYDDIRPDFSETGSPRLAMGLNLGAQLHWQFTKDPSLKNRVHRIVTYPQFWTHKLTGVFASDRTSLGCHTDLWNPFEEKFSSLPETLGIKNKIAKPRRPGGILGPLLPQLASRTGLPEDTPVYCGIHDSNASLLPHLFTRKPPFSVVSTGTWVVAMSVGGKPVTLDPSRDTLVNVNAFDEAVPSARFMGGREHDLALGNASVQQPNDTQISRVLNRRRMLLPALVPNTGPFAGMTSRWCCGEPAIGSVERTVTVSFYLALVTAQSLSLIGHDGPVIVEGPFAKNKPYLWMLRAASSSTVIAMESMTGVSHGAALLVAGHGLPILQQATFALPDSYTADLLINYAKRWNIKVQEN